MPDDFDPSPHVPLPTEGEFRTSYSNPVWWRHTGKHFALGLGVTLGVCTAVSAAKGMMPGALPFVIGFACLLGLVWGFVILVRNRRTRHHRVVIEWAKRAIHFEGIRSSTADLLDPKSIGLTIGFEELLDARRDAGYQWTPAHIIVRAKETAVSIGLHFDDIEGLTARLVRIGNETPKATLTDGMRLLRKNSGCSPVTLFVLLAGIALLILITVMSWP